MLLLSGEMGWQGGGAWLMTHVFGTGQGAAESGKSTLVKQMKIIHSHGFTKQELASFKVRPSPITAATGMGGHGSV